jgi:hypothetical protein
VVQAAPASPKPKPGSDYGGPAAARDAFYTDTAQDRRLRSTARPQPNDGRRGQVQTAGFIGPDGSFREAPAPDYTPKPLDR